MNRSFDVLVIGGGPAGTSAAITCAQSGLDVCILEDKEFPRYHVGETVHPGIEGLFKQLNVGDEILSANFLRHVGNWVKWQNEEIFVPFGHTHQELWKGFQLVRSEFDKILLDHARDNGVHLVQPCQAFRPLMNKAGKIIGVNTSEGKFNSSYLIDAAGSQNWLSHKLGLKMIKHSPALIAYYGYVKGEFANCNKTPLLVADDDGWTWIAEVKPFVYQWTRLFFDYKNLDKNYVPKPLLKMEKIGYTSCSDVTWRLSSLPSGKGFFLVGDAASVLDPSSSHGILKAIMSGMLVGHLISKTEKLQITIQSAIAIYNKWITEWFMHDKFNITKLYRELINPPKWIL